MPKKILNLWCGTWSNIPELINRWELICVDIDEENIIASKRKFPEAKYICSSWEEMIFDKKWFDEIYCFDVLEHVSDLDLVMQKIMNYLKDDGLLYIEIPYDKSEKILLKINPKYFNQIGHKRVFQFSELEKTFNEYGFNITYKAKSRGIAHIYLVLLFLLKIDITDQTCKIDPKKRLIERLIMWITIWFDKNILNTYLKYIPLWILTLPVWYVLSQIFPKTIILKLSKNENSRHIDS